MSATLIVLGGLPGSGKTTVARAYVRSTRAAFVRIDTIEQAVVDGTSLSRPLGPVGYEVGHALAAEQLRLGVDVVAECVNPLRITRDAWSATAAGAGAALLEVEVVCSDPEEHRRRVESRRTDIPGLALPTWQHVLDREYEPWDRDRLVLDTARSTTDGCVAALTAAVARNVGPGEHRPSPRSPTRRAEPARVAATDLDPLDRLAAERACERLVVEFARRLDLGRPADVADLFTEDGVWEWPEGGRRVRGRPELARYFASRPDDRLSRRLCTNLLVTVQDVDRAESTSYLTTYRVDGWAGELRPPPAPTQVGHHEDRFRRVGGVWLLEHRSTFLAFGGPTPRAGSSG